MDFFQLGSLHTSGKPPFPCKTSHSLSLSLSFNSGYDPLVHSVLIPFLKREIERFNKLLSVIHKSLKNLQLAIKGESILTPDLEETYDSFLRARVPTLWQVSSHVCLPLASTLTELTALYEEIVATTVLTSSGYKCDLTRPIRQQCGNSTHLPQSWNSVNVKQPADTGRGIWFHGLRSSHKMCTRIKDPIPGPEVLVKFWKLQRNTEAYVCLWTHVCPNCKQHRCCGRKSRSP